MQKESSKVFKNFVLILSFLGGCYAADEPEADASQMPRIPAIPPAKALSTFELRPGIALDLVAHEPLVEDPVSIAFDEDGRLFAVEMRGYSERRDDNRGQIRMLFDDDDDGTFDRSTVYAKGLKWPTGLVCSQGGVFVVATPDLIWFKDTDGDGVADERKVVFTGFAEGAKKLNVQGLANSLKWGPDNRIWGSSGTLAGKIGKVSLSGSDFSFDPKTLDFRAENGRAQYGMSFDSNGRRFSSSNSVHIISVMWERGWANPNSHYSLPKPFVSIATDGGAAPVYRISPDEPWRIIRTRWRVAGVVRGMVEGGGRVSGYFTGASGITIYTGDALGPDYVDNAFTGDVGSNLVHRKIVSNHASKVALRADRAPEEEKREFIASTDNWFRPTTYANAPDGCLYISDMYRETIEHPWSLPPGIKKHLDLNSGNDKGRVYRVRPTEFARRKTPRLSEASNQELAALLDHPNGWHRTTAQRLLWERGDPKADSGWAETGAGDDSLAALKRPFSLATADSDTKVRELTKIIESSPKDEWLLAAALHAISTAEEAGGIFAALSKDGIEGRDYLVPLAGIIGRMNKDGATETVLAAAVADPENSLTVRILESLGGGLSKAKSSLSKADKSGKLDGVFSAALGSLRDDAQPSAIELLAFSPDKSVDKALEAILKSPGKDKLYAAALQSLRKRRSKSLATVITENWVNFPASVKSAGLSYLLENATNSLVLVSAIEQGGLAETVINQSQIQLLRDSKSSKIRNIIEELYPVEKIKPRSEVVAEYQGALKLKGDSIKGETIYKTACASCHKHGTEGHAVGPDLATFKTAGSDSIIANLFHPNKEIAPQYQVYVFTLKNGEQTMGIISNETTTEVTVKMAFGVEKTFNRTDVATMKATGKSLMPEGLEGVLNHQSLADLLAYINAK